MPRPPTRIDERSPVHTVIAMGRKTEHWKTLAAQFPCVRNCVIDVRRAFTREHGEDTSGTGFDSDVRQRIKMKPAWPVVFEIAMLVLQTFGLCIVLCNHGKHRSVTVAYEVAKRSAALLVSPRYGNGKLQDASPSVFLETVLLRLLQHRDMHAHSSHPLLAIGEVVSNFDGRCWAVQHQLPENDYFDLSAGDIAVEISRQGLENADGWSYGIIIRKGEIYRGRWFPPAFVRDSSQQLVSGVAHFCASLLSESN